MSLSTQEAIKRLANDSSSYDTLDKLLELVEQISVKSEAPLGSPTVLYSGDIKDGLKAEALIDEMLDAGEKIRVIKTTPVAAFLDSDEFIAALARRDSVSVEDFRDRGYESPTKKWLFHPTDGPWAKASKRFENRAKTGDRKPGTDHVFH